MVVKRSWFDYGGCRALHMGRVLHRNKTRSVGCQREERPAWLRPLPPPVLSRIGRRRLTQVMASARVEQDAPFCFVRRAASEAPQWSRSKFACMSCVIESWEYLLQRSSTVGFRPPRGWSDDILPSVPGGLTASGKKQRGGRKPACSIPDNV